MKKIFFILAFTLLCAFSFGQTLHKGNLVGVHVFTPDLKEGMTIQDLGDFIKNKWLPEVNKVFPDLKGYLVKSIRGDDSTSLGIIFIAKSESDRNRYWTADNKLKPDVQKAVDKMLERLRKENEKYVTALQASDKYNDWVLQ